MDVETEQISENWKPRCATSVSTYRHHFKPPFTFALSNPNMHTSSMLSTNFDSKSPQRRTIPSLHAITTVPEKKKTTIHLCNYRIADGGANDVVFIPDAEVRCRSIVRPGSSRVPGQPDPPPTLTRFGGLPLQRTNQQWLQQWLSFRGPGSLGPPQFGFAPPRFQVRLNQCYYC